MQPNKRFMDGTLSYSGISVKLIFLILFISISASTEAKTILCEAKIHNDLNERIRVNILPELGVSYYEKITSLVIEPLETADVSHTNVDSFSWELIYPKAKVEVHTGNITCKETISIKYKQQDTTNGVVLL